jgi:hypothetical protein
MKVKTVICFLIAFFVLCGVAFAEPITVLNPSFEYVDGELILWWTDGVIPDYWTFAGTGSYGVEDPSTDGYVCVYIGEDGSVFQLLDHKIYPGDEYVLKFDAQHVWSGGGQGGTYEGILYYDDNGTRIPIDSVGGLGILGLWNYEELVVAIPSGSPATGKYIGVEFAADQSPNNSMGFDNIRLDMTQSVMRAEDPAPSDGTDRVLLDTVLSWTTGGDPNNPTEPNPSITKHFVYMNTGSPSDPNLYLKATIPAGVPPAATAEYPTEGLEREKTYMWRVDEGIGVYEPDDPRNITGLTWSFKTVLSVPMFEANLPADVQVFLGETVVFTVEATNPYTMDSTGMSYAWYKVGEPAVLSTTDTLEIADVQVADEGGYYCTVTIDGMADKAADSRTADLLLKRLVGHWKLDGDLSDEAEGRTGTGDVSFVFGIDGEGQAVQFTGEGNIIQIPDSEDAFNFYPKGYTMSAWAKTTQTGWGALIAKQDRGETWKGIVLNHYTSRAVHTLRQGFGDLHAYDTPINDDNWHLITATYDGKTGVGKIYVDGVVINETEPASYEIETNEFPLIFGAETVEASESVYLGLLDDVRIWNWPIDKYEIADMYLEFRPGEALCVEAVEHDLDDDCMMTLNDIMVLAENWLGCNIVPTCFE